MMALQSLNPITNTIQHVELIRVSPGLHCRTPNSLLSI